MALIQMDLYSSCLRMKTGVTVILPFRSMHDMDRGLVKGMFPENGQKYQTLWLLNEGAGNDLNALSYSSIVRYADKHMLAVVMPTGYNMNTDDFEGSMRMCEYAGSELPLMLRNIFPLSPKREDNFIGGASMGSNGAQKVAIRYPESFCAVLGMSAGSFNVRPKGAAMPKRNWTIPMPPHKPDEMEENCAILRDLIARGGPVPEFFLIWGEHDIAREGSLRSAEFLRSAGAKVFSEEIPGAGHDWYMWDKQLERALNELLPLRHDLV